MANAILDGTGSGFTAKVNSDNRLLVDLGGDIVISGVNIDSIVIQETNPLDENKNNPEFDLVYLSSGTSTGLNSGSQIGTIVQYIDAGSFVKVLSYTNNNLVNVGSWI